MKKALIGIMTLSLASSSVMLAQDKKADTKATGSNTATTADPVVIKFGTTEIRQSEFEAAVKSLPPEYQEMAKGPARRQFAEEYVRMKMLAVQGEKEGVLNDPVVKAQLALMRDNTIANATLTRIQQSLTVSDADVQKAYEAQKSTFERVSARHILIAPKESQAFQPGKKEYTDAQAKAHAEELRKKIAGGADFAALAKAESFDTVSGGKGGDLGAFGRGDMVPEFEQAVFTAKPGEVTPVVKTEFGYHIIQVQSRDAAPLTEVRPQLEQRLKQTLLQARLDQMKTAQAVTFDDKYFAPPTPPTPPAAATEAPAAPAPPPPAVKQ